MLARVSHWIDADHFAPAPGAVIGCKAASKTYVGRRQMVRAWNRLEVDVVDGGEARALNPRLDLTPHSPDGFEIGYNGSGCAQLALAICCDALGDDTRALALYQSFKVAVIAKLDRDRPFTIQADAVIAWAERIEAAS